MRRAERWHFFKPQRLEWEDIEGGVGENTYDEIYEFANKYGYNEYSFDSDEDLSGDLAVFADDLCRLLNDMYDATQVVAALSLIQGAFYTSCARDAILDALLKSGTKKDVVNLAFDVSAVYCKYIELRNRVQRAEEE